MIIDHLENFSHYHHLHPLMPSVSDFLSKTDLTKFDSGCHEIDGEKLYLSVTRNTDAPTTPPLLECHRLYWDIQIAAKGEGVIWWKHLRECSRFQNPYNLEKDYLLMEDPHEIELPWNPHYFAIFMPQDAHTTFAKNRDLIKSVIKLRI